MSSILKALKKLEDELPREDETGLPQINTKKVVSKHAKRTRMVNNVLSIVVIAFVLTGSAWLILKQKPLWVKKLFPSAVSTEQPPLATVYSEKKTPEQDLAQKKIPDISVTAKHENSGDSGPDKNPNQVKTGTVVPLHVKKRNTTVIPNSRIPRNDKPVPVPAPVIAKPQPEKNRQSVATGQKPLKTVQPAPVIVKPQLEENVVEETPKAEQPAPAIVKPQLEKNVVEETPKAEQSAPVIVKPQLKEDTVEEDQKPLDAEPAPFIAKPQPEEETAPVEDVVEAEQHADVEQIDDPRLTIQALVWSSDPEGRMAMINNKIIRMGGSVDGIVVTHIDGDYVIVREGDKEWKQVFQIK
ncbi:MAG: GspB domain-containing protein [Desulfobacteraceae bacterium]|nr:GspB domain-containing protein [Desulfobacteraceae bacterium]